jgi:uncharacterized protein (DUF2342 family)
VVLGLQKEQVVVEMRAMSRQKEGAISRLSTAETLVEIWQHHVYERHALRASGIVELGSTVSERPMDDRRLKRDRKYKRIWRLCSQE